MAEPVERARQQVVDERSELERLRARVDELERELADRPPTSRPNPKPGAHAQHTEFRTALYEALLYGLARSLSLYDASSVRVIVRELGRRIREYLEELGYHVGSGETVAEVIEETVAFYVDHGFADLELVSWENDVIRAKWHRLLGLRAYERIVAAGAETFVSCPLNAMLHDSLAAFGKELILLRKEFQLDKETAESWEALVDVPTDATSTLSLSLSPERVLEHEREQGRQLRLRDDFIRLASHELATPLTSAKLALGRLTRMDLPEASKASLAMVDRQLRRLERLVAEMLETTQLQIGRIKLTREPTDLVPIVRNVVEAIGSSPLRDRAEVVVRGETSVIGEWDGARLEQVVANLVSNAVKYGRGRPVTVEVRRQEDGVRLTVQDEGIGMSAEVMNRLFNPFERGVSSAHYAGLGLGLFIARRIVQMHGGALTVESTLGEGSTFTVALPLATARDPRTLVQRPTVRTPS